MDTFMKQDFEQLHKEGLALLKSGELEKSELIFRQILSVIPLDIAAFNNLGLALLGQKKYAEAVEVYQEAINLDGKVAPLYHNIGLGFYRLGQLENAVKSYRSALSINPEYADALQNLGAALKDIGNRSEALLCYQRLLELRPDDANIKYMLDSLTGENHQKEAPKEYVAKLFDDYADRFETQLVIKLHYHIPKKLYQVFTFLVQSETLKFSNLLDLGCGTGLVAEEFYSLADWITGVDLSIKMLGKAQVKNLYNELHHAGLEDFIANSTSRYDFVIAADVFVYVGQLDSIFELLAAKMTKGGYFLFSTEDNPDGLDFSLLTTSRYGHSPVYIQSISHRNDFLIRLCKPTMIRKERGEELMGSLYVLQFFGH